MRWFLRPLLVFTYQSHQELIYMIVYDRRSDSNSRCFARVYTRVKGAARHRFSIGKVLKLGDGMLSTDGKGI